MPEGTARRGGARSSADNGVDALKSRITELEGELRYASERNAQLLDQRCFQLVLCDHKRKPEGDKPGHQTVPCRNRRDWPHTARDRNR